MAERPSTKDILAALRKGEAAKSSEPAASASASVSSSASEATAAPKAAPSSAAQAPTAAELGRPLTIKEKLAAARAGAVSAPAGGPANKSIVSEPSVTAEATLESQTAAPAPVAHLPTAAELGRPLTVKEKLAAARASAGGAAAPASAKPAVAKVAGEKTAPASAKPAAAAAARTLPPLESMSDPRDLAEAARRTGAERELSIKEKVAAAKGKPAEKVASKVVPSKAVPGKPERPQTVRGRVADVSRRAFMGMTSWVALGWVAFTAGVGLFSAILGRFMFPNVLAEPPSTIKVGAPGNFEKGEVSERWKAEWGFWIVRSDYYDSLDKIYALSTVCTHLGCPPNWLASEQKFKCPCHGSGYYISGVNFEGPAPRPLERFKIALGDDGQIIVDKSQKFQEEQGQWKDPDSFVPV